MTTDTIIDDFEDTVAEPVASLRRFDRLTITACFLYGLAFAAGFIWG